jgi:hypothetical protein
MAGKAERVSDVELRSFIEKLNAWADSLNLGEKALLQILLERAAGRLGDKEDADLAFPASAGFGKTVTPFLHELVASGALSVRAPSLGGRAVEGWVKDGDPWVKGGSFLDQGDPAQ